MATAGSTLPDLDVAGAFTPQPLVLTVMASYAPEGNGAWPVSDLLALVAGVGVDEPALRTALWRLKKREVVVATGTRRAAAYALNPDLAQVFAEGDERIFDATRAGAEDPWLMVAASVPEAERPRRHRLKRVLAQRGFGTVGAGLWISPDHHGAGVRRALEREDLARFVDYFSVLPDPEGLAAKVASWWDLDALGAAYADYRVRQAAVLADGAGTPALAFAAQVRLLTAWRRLPFLDPGIPLDLVPDGWPGRGAAEEFLAAHDALVGPAEEHVRSVVSVPVRLRLPVGR